MQSAAFGGNTFDPDLGATYANFKDKNDAALSLFFNTVAFHNIMDGSRIHGHHPHGAAALGDTEASQRVRDHLLQGKPDLYRQLEAMVDTFETSFSGRILQIEETEKKANSWLLFSEKEFFPGGSQEVPGEELVMRYRILLTKPELATLEDCREASSYTDDNNQRQLMTTEMLKSRSPIFARMVAVAESL